MNFLRKTGFSVAILAAMSASSCSNDSVETNISPDNEVWTYAQDMSNDDYEQAESVAATTPERTAVEWARELDGTRGRRNFSPQKMTKIRQAFTESQAPDVRAAIAIGLGNAMDLDSTDVLLDAMEDEPPEVRAAAAKSISRIHGWGSEYQVDQPLEKRQEVVAIYRERWDQVKGSSLYDAWKNPDKKAATARRAQKKAKTDWRRERAQDEASD